MGSCNTRYGLILGFSLLAGAAYADCQEGVIWTRNEDGKARFSVEVADTAAERGIGLMNRPSMPGSAGMLFVYSKPQRVAFWMKNTLIPLDIIFADQHGVVQKVHSFAVPKDLTPIPGGDDIQYVLEINGGLANGLGIKAGSVLQHLDIDQEKAAWSCK